MLLHELCGVTGVSGREGEVRRILKAHLGSACDEMIVDNLGNLLCKKDGSSEDMKTYTVMVAAHMDEVGFMITGIGEEGLLKFELIGGMDPRILPGTRVRVGPDRLAGVIGLRPAHQKSEEAKGQVVAVSDLRIDLGAVSRKEAERYVRPGEFASFDSDLEEWPGGRVKARALDDRVGCAILAEILAEKEFPFTLWGAFTAQEEVGLRGAQTASYRISPDVGIALEGTICADLPGNTGKEATRMGEGAALSIMDRTSIPNQQILDELVRLAEAKKIPYQYRLATFGGNDAGPMNQVAEGAKTAIISVPCRYIHSGAAVCSYDDIDAVKSLLTTFLDSLAEGFRP